MPTKLTERRKKLFLAELARHGILVRAARAASPRASSRYGAKQTFLDERERDPEFFAKRVVSAFLDFKRSTKDAAIHIAIRLHKRRDNQRNATMQQQQDGIKS